MALQLTCPYCKHEFPYNNGKLDADISEIGQRLQTIHRRLAEIKFERHDGESWYERKLLIKEQTVLQEKIAGLKAIRKAADQQILFYSYNFLKEIIKEKYGQAEYMAIMRQVEENLQAYKIRDMMKHEYSKGPSKSTATSVEKL